MDNLDNFFEVLPTDESQTTETFAPFSSVRQSWATADSISRSLSNWIVGNFSDTFDGAFESNIPSRIASRAVISVRRIENHNGKSVYAFIHA